MKSKTKKSITLASLAVASVLAFGGAAAMQGGVRANAEVTESSSAEVTRESALTMNSGASVRINAPTGIRFGATLSSDKYAEIIENGDYKAGYSVGMIVVPETYFEEFDAQTENTDYYSYFSSVKGKMIDLPFESDQFTKNTETGDYNFYGAITDIYEVNFDRDFQAVAYVKNGDAYSYSNVSDARNIQYVAKAAIEAGKLTIEQMNSLNTAYNLGGYTALNVTVPTQEEPLSVYVSKAAENVTGADVAAVIHARYGLKVAADGFNTTAFENNGTYTATIKPTVTVKFANGKTQQLQTVYGEEFEIPADSSAIFETENDCTLSAEELKNLTDDITVTYKVTEKLLHTNADGFAVKFNDESGWTLQSKNAYAAAVIMQGASKTHYVKYTVNKPANEKSEEFGMYVSDDTNDLLYCLWPNKSNRVLNIAGDKWAVIPTYDKVGEPLAVAKLFDTNATTLTFEMFLVGGTIYYYTDGVLITSVAVNAANLAEANRLDTNKEYTVGFATLGTEFSILNTYTDFEHLVGDEALEKYYDSRNIADIAYSQGKDSATVSRVDNGILLSSSDAFHFSAYLTGSEQVKGKSFVVETKIATKYFSTWNTYGFGIKYSNGKFLTLGVSSRGGRFAIAYLLNGSWKGDKNVLETTDAQDVKANYKNQEYLTLKVLFNVDANTYYVFGNGALLGELTASELEIGDWGDIEKVGFGARIDDGNNKIMEFSNWNYSVLSVAEVTFTKGYYNSTLDNERHYTAITTDSLAKSYKYTQNFTKETLPVGSIIYIASGWKYRPEGWVNGARNANRPGDTTTQYVLVTEEWWGSFTERAFNVYKTDTSDITAQTQTDMESVFKIYLPNN